MSPRPPLPPEHWWSRLSAEAVRLFHVYGNWLVRITWTGFVVRSIVLLIASLIFADIAASGSNGNSEEVTITPAMPVSPLPPHPATPRQPKAAIDKSNADEDAVTISIDRNGVRLSPRGSAAKASAAAPAPTASASSDSASGSAAGSGSAAAASSATAALPHGISARIQGDGVEIKLPPGADSEAVREAVAEARTAVVEAIRESQQQAAEHARELADEARQSIEANRNAVRTIRHMRSERSKPPFTGLAWFFVFASAILKVSYKGTVQAEVKAAVATEAAESEQLKRQVVEARMAAMQAQVEPHFLFNTLASIDHLIETDPARASQMQKNLIALLRASMPTMRESNVAAQTLGREMAVIRPYLAILKVRMEDRLQSSIAVPEGLLSAEFPPMMIQSLVENAIKHGLEPKADGGQLDVRAEIIHGNLAVTVADTGLGFRDGIAETSGTGIGLANIRERLKLLYGERASLLVADNTPTGTVVTITVPYQAQAREGVAA